jgi:hypothetical protein
VSDSGQDSAQGHKLQAVVKHTDKNAAFQVVISVYERVYICFADSDIGIIGMIYSIRAFKSTAYPIIYMEIGVNILYLFEKLACELLPVFEFFLVHPFKNRCFCGIWALIREY